jgi:chromosome segregation ATPase
MRLHNQGKNALSWDMGGERFSCEPWGAIEIPDALVSAVRSRGLPLDVTPVAPELRAQVRVADERAASDAAPLLALRKQADDAQASERAAKAEVEALSVELSAERGKLRDAREQNAELAKKLKAAAADKEAAERLLTEASAQATASEERAIKAEALLAERSKGGKPDKPKSAEAR